MYYQYKFVINIKLDKDKNWLNWFKIKLFKFVINIKLVKEIQLEMRRN